MMQFRITEGTKVLMMATVDVDAQQVIHLTLDDEDPIGSIYVALKTLELHIEESMTKWTVHGPKVTPVEWAHEAIREGYEIGAEPIESHPYFEEMAKRFGTPPFPPLRSFLPIEITKPPKAVTPFSEPELSTEQMMTAMGLIACPEKTWLLCAHCIEEWATAIRTDGKRKIGWCKICLPLAFKSHMVEQAALDRLTEADQPQEGGVQ